MLLLSREQLNSAWEGDAIFIKIELAGCSVDGRHTSLYCLTAVVKHYGGDTDVSRLIHEYAISEDEPPRRLLRKMAEDLEFATKIIKVSWEKLPKLGAAYPAIAFKKDGSTVVVCGVRQVPVEPPKPSGAPELAENAGEPAVSVETPEDRKAEEPELKLQIAVWDPVAKNGRKPRMEFKEREYFEQELSGELMLLKKHYSILEENQPFGLRWFIPEFYRQHCSARSLSQFSRSASSDSQFRFSSSWSSTRFSCMKATTR